MTRRSDDVLAMAAPLVVSFWMRALFTFVDAIYAASVGDAAVAAIGLSFPFEFLMIAIWVVLGCLIDSISIILLTVPIFAPIAAQLGFDPLAFAIIGILAIETGLLTPPFGLCVFTVKAAVPDRSVELAEIFRGSIPYWTVLLIVVALFGFTLSYDEFARTPFADIKALAPRMPREKLLAWVQDKTISAMRRRQYLALLAACGQKDEAPVIERLLVAERGGPEGALDATAGCYLTLAGEAGLPLISSASSTSLSKRSTSPNWMYSRP